eukprot:TRINITY_DN3549_c0_g1_i1.p1 TRINITY_DN3549_c0_g1~~TRINITY_DN3549_c0_g1_i1.p1  ORF type:complete len:295 (+),score=71.29 TRINITY_DN3549_c0_g1_i1:82-966(+)
MAASTECRADDAVAADKEVMKQAIGLIDHTSLGLDDTEAGIQALVDAAVAAAPHTAAVCIYPKFISFVRSLQKDQPEKYPRSLKVATVVNFPGGQEPVEKVVADASQAVKDGADEVDMVIDYRGLLDDMKAGQKQAEDLTSAVRAVCPEASVALKVIIESGELKTPELIAAACDAALAGGADFVKTSTGKVSVNATPDAARTMLQRVAAYRSANPKARTIGFKAAGGVKTLEQVKQYLGIAAECLFETADARDRVDASLFRFGSSGLLPVLRQALREDEPARGTKRKAEDDGAY